MKAVFQRVASAEVRSEGRVTGRIGPGAVVLLGIGRADTETDAAKLADKVAKLRGVEVLNINELSNAVKPVVIPGESMTVTVVKNGKEPGQGVAYLDDGTMIVVENGHRHLGATIDVEVTSALQTAAGRMIFAKPKA